MPDNNYYDLLEVKWGDETLRARPVEWDKDITAFDFNPETDTATATKYETVCPKCGNSCSFMSGDVKVTCENCKAFTDLKVITPAELDVNIIMASSVQPEPVKDIIKLNNELDIELDQILEERDNELGIAGPEDIIDNLTKSIMNNEIDMDEPQSKPNKKKKK